MIAAFEGSIVQGKTQHGAHALFYSILVHGGLVKRECTCLYPLWGTQAIHSGLFPLVAKRHSAFTPFLICLDHLREAARSCP